MKQSTKDKLTELKGEYLGNPFDKDNRVMIDFLAFVVEHYENKIQKAIDIGESK